jgi:hypothetical protein
MLRIEWEDKWINTLIDAGCNPGTARTSFWQRTDEVARTSPKILHKKQWRCWEQ